MLNGSNDLCSVISIDSALTANMQLPPLADDVFALCLGRSALPFGSLGDRPALRDATDVISYKELAERVRKCAAGLPVVDAGGLLGIPALQSVDSIIAILAALAAGVPYVAVTSSVSPRVLERLVGIVAVPGAPDLPVPQISLSNDVTAALLPPTLDDSIAYVVATSGSSGESKETLVTRRGLAAVFNALGQQWGGSLPWGARWTQLHPLTFGYSMCEILGSLLFGGELVIMHKGGATSTAPVLRLCSDGLPTVVCLTPSELSLFSAKRVSVPPTHVILSGEPAHKAALHDFFTLPGATSTTVINTYATSETSGQITSHKVCSADVNATVAGFVGPILPGIGVMLVDTDGDDIPSNNYGSVGEIYISGPTIAAGYLDRARSEERFVNQSGTRYFKTGDLGSWSPEGLYVHGRANRTRKLAGQWINLDDIERALLKDPNIAEVAVVDERMQMPGLVFDRLRVVVVLNANEERVRAKVIGLLPIRITVLLTVTTHIPRLPSGKVDLQTLSGNMPNAFTLVSDIRGLILDTWKLILGDGVQTDTNLFELGLDSLGLIAAAGRLSDVLHTKVSPEFLLDHPCIDLQIARLTGGQMRSPNRRTPKTNTAQTRRLIRKTQSYNKGKV